MGLPIARSTLTRLPLHLLPGARAASTYTPAVGFLLDKVGIDQEKASRIPTTGPKGRLLKGDVLAYLGRIKARPAPEWNSTSYPPFGQGTAPSSSGSTVSTATMTANGPFECHWRGISMDALTSKCSAWSESLEKRVKVEELVARALSLSLASTLSSSVKADCTGPSDVKQTISSSKDTSLSDFLSSISKGSASSLVTLDISTSTTSSISTPDPDLITPNMTAAQLMEELSAQPSGVKPSTSTSTSDLVFTSAPTPAPSTPTLELSMNDVFNSLLPTSAQPGRTSTLHLTLRSLPGGPLDPDQAAEVMGRMINLLEDPSRLS
ncbi:MAG: hypothetical protein DHS80DRAFT_31664 [Piptocephalis tieghemiana]|nr:MAG: hypothetical protein DHS80DRAFT_31664 [Piptocephalis tieghemiana]